MWDNCMVVESEELKTSFGRQGNKLIPHFPAFFGENISKYRFNQNKPSGA